MIVPLLDGPPTSDGPPQAGFPISDPWKQTGSVKRYVYDRVHLGGERVEGVGQMSATGKGEEIMLVNYKDYDRGHGSRGFQSGPAHGPPVRQTAW